MLKVVLVGVGGISGAHIPVWKKMEDAELAAICDIRPEQMEKYPDIKHYTDYDEMLEKESPDIVDICLPTNLHIEFSLKALNKGINVLCEKPVSLNPDDVKKVYEAAEKNNVKFMVAQVIRFFPEYEIVKNLKDSEQYGKLLSGSMWRLSVCPGWSWDGWMKDEKRSGLVPFDLHIHDLDYLIYAFGSPENVSVNRTKRPEQDYLNAVYQFDGFSVTSEASWYAAKYDFKMGFRFQFEKALVAYEEGKFIIYDTEGNKINPLEASENDTGNIGLPNSDGYANEIIYFADCVKNNKPADKVKATELQEVVKILNSMV